MVDTVFRDECSQAWQQKWNSVSVCVLAQSNAFFVYMTCCVCLEVQCAHLYVIGKATLEDGVHTYVCVHPQMCSKFIMHIFMQYVERVRAYTIMTQLFVYGSTF